MFTRILCASDGSADGDRALDFARELAVAYDSTLRVVHVATDFPGGWNVHADEDRRISKLKVRIAGLRRHDIDASLHVIRGGKPSEVARLIADTADAVEADVVIVGTRGAPPLGAAARRSVTCRLLHIAGRPVLAVPRAHGAVDQTGTAARRPAHAA